MVVGMTLSPSPKRPRSKSKKLLLWIGGGVVGLVILLMVIGAIGVANSPGGWDAALAEQAADKSAKAEQKERDKAAEAEEEAVAEAQRVRDEESAKAESAAQEAATASQEAERVEAEAKAAAELESAQKKKEAESAAAEAKAKKDAEATEAKAKKEAETRAKADAEKAKKDKAAADKKAAAEKKEAKRAEANQWWFDDKGSLLTGHIRTLKEFTDAAVSEDYVGMLTACADMQEQTKFMGQRSIDRVSYPSGFGKDVESSFDRGSASFRSAAKGCKAVFDDGELTRADQTGVDVATAQYSLQAVKDAIYGKYVELK